MKYLEPDHNWWGLDVEGNGLEPTKLWLVCVTNYETGERLHFTDSKSFKQWRLKEHVYITHNGLKADVPWLNQLWKCNIDVGCVVDTFVLSQLFDPSMPAALKDWGIRLNSPKIEFEDFSKYSEEMLTYCYQDVKLTLKVYKAISKQLKKVGFSEKSIELEHQVVPIIHRQQQDGFYFDKEKAIALANNLREEQRRLVDKIGSVFPPELKRRGDYAYRVKPSGEPYKSFLRHSEIYDEIRFEPEGRYAVYSYESFNIGSSTQRTERLINLGYIPTSFTEKGAPKVDEAALLEFAKTSGIKEVQYIAEWLVLEGRANAVEGWLENLGQDNAIHGNVFTCGAQSRRMRHSNPNTANIPGVDAKYGYESRALWVSRPGRVLVGVDAVALEGRMLLHYLNSDAAWKYFIEGDPHQSNSDALQRVGLKISRKQSKNYFYGFLYGAGNRKLASMYGSSDPSVGQLIRDTFSTNIPGLGELIHSVEQEWEGSSGLLRTIDGGFVRCPIKSAALNYKLQPAGAILMKEALVIADKRLKKVRLDYIFVGNIHDEWQIDCRPQHAHSIGEICADSIREAGERLNFNVPQAGDFKLGFNWAETH